jgi:hypothetical protein
MARCDEQASWKHDDLAADLAQHLRSDARMVWTDMQLGPAGSPRPDVYTLERSYSKPLPTAYECKISRSDLRSDTTSGKWQKYLAYAGAVIFAVPDGLCTVNDIPTGCGLIVRKDQTWRHVRKATRQAASLPMDACMKLLIDGVNRSVERHMAKPREVTLWREHEAVRQKFGSAVARAAADLTRAQTEIRDLDAIRREGWIRVDKEVAAHREYKMTEVKREMAVFEEARRDLIAWLELPESSGALSIRRAIDRLKTRCDADERVRSAERSLEDARITINSALSMLDRKVAA